MLQYKTSLFSAVDAALHDLRNYTQKTRLKRVVNAFIPYAEELMYAAWTESKKNGATYLEFRNKLSQAGLLPKGLAFTPPVEYLKPALIPISETTLIDSSKLIQTFPGPDGKPRHVTNWFNCSAVKYKGKIYFAYRMDFAPFAQEMKVGLCLLNEDFTVVPGSNVLPTLHSQYGGWHVEDPRLFIFQDKLYLSYTDGYQMGQALVNPDTLQAKESFYLRKRMNAITEKNWVFFEDTASGKLYCIYNSIPYTLFEMDGANYRKVHVAQIPPVWVYGRIAGGAAPVLHGDYYYHFFHSSITREQGVQNPIRRQYFCGCYVMEKHYPFNVVAITSKPLLAGEYIEPFVTRMSNDIYVVFPGGAYHENDEWVLSFGYNDLSCRIAHVSDMLLSDNLTWFPQKVARQKDWSELVKLHGWCLPDKMQRLYDLVILSDAKTTVELGVFGGRSLFPMAMAHKDKGTGYARGFDSYSHEDCVEGSNDPENNSWWKSLDLDSIYKETLEWMNNNGLEPWCRIERMNTKDAHKHFENNSIDILHQDSNHSSEVILEELKLWIAKLKVDGYWINDDANWKEAQAGYSRLPEFGLKLLEDFSTWQIWQKVQT